MNKMIVSMMAALGLGLAACGSSSTLGDCPTDSTAAQVAGRTVVEQRCGTACHNSMLTGAARANAPSDVNYDSIAAIQLNLEEGWSQVESRQMPEGSTLTDAEIESIRVFLACGAPNVAAN